MLWQVFGQRMERGWKWTEGKKRFDFYSVVIKYVHPVSLNRVIFYCPQLDFLSDRLWRLKMYLLVCGDCTDTHYPSVSDQKLMKHSALQNRYQLIFAHFVFTSLKYRCRMKALDHQTQVVVLWLLQMLSSHSRCADNSQKASMRWWTGRQYEIKVIFHIHPVK